MRADEFVSRLDRPRQTGPASWVARCPAHDDRSPSLTVSEGSDGRILVHCFAGCEVENVVGAVGVSLSDLMPETGPANHVAAPKRMRVPPMDVLRALAFQAKVVAICACDMGRGIQLSEEEKDKLLATAAEIDEAIEYATR